MGFASAIPSMFIRRLMLLGAGFLAGLAALGAQSYRLTVLKGGEYLDRAESRLVLESWTQTVRGRILDRKGRVLAQDKAGFDVMVDYPVITGEWAYDQAARAARQKAVASLGKAAWARMSGTQRDDRTRAELPEFESRLRAVWGELGRVLGLPPEELARRRSAIRERVQRVVASTKSRWLEERREKFGTLNERGEELSLRDVDRPVGVQSQAYAVATGVGDDKLFELRRIGASLPGVEIIEAAVRVYPYETVPVSLDRSRFPSPLRTDTPLATTVSGVATHVLGWMRGLQAEDLTGRPRKDPSTGELDRGMYMEHDRVGGAGIEGSQERVLRGLRGVTRLHRDTNEKEVEPSIPGSDVSVTIDIALQARVQAIMSEQSGLGRLNAWQLSPILEQRPKVPVGTALNGATVVLDIQTGDILAMVSTPSFTRAELTESPGDVWGDELNAPFVNRAVAKRYPPGSVVKPLILCAAVTEGVHALDRPIDCTGHLFPNSPGMFRCWVYKQWPGRTHTADFGHPLGAIEALGVSCNIYFFTLGRALGLSGVEKWYKAFGVGEAFNLGIGTEWAGSVLQKQGTVGGKPEPAQLSDAIFMGIGQGPVDWTPLHAANAYAAIARGGLWMSPRILRDAPPRARDLKLDSRAVDASLAGLYEVINNATFGGGHHITVSGVQEPLFNHPDLDIRGKTGTAAAPRLYSTEDQDDDGRRDVLREGDHSWFVVLAGPKGRSPRYAVATIMEYAGSGGRVSGPIANQVLWALKDEGYLP